MRTAVLLLVLAAWPAHAQPILPDTLTLYDTARERRIPIAIYRPADLWGSNLVLLSHGYNENRPGTYLLYSYLAEHLAAHGFTVVSIQHELPGDEPLAMKGDLQVLRRPNWERGVENIRFVMEEMQRMHPELDRDHISLIGHSNGGDISVLFGHEDPSLVEKVVTLDNRRMPFRHASRPRLLSLRASDAIADSGVVPGSEDQKAYGIRIVQLANTRHEEMNDRANAAQRDEINRLVLEFLDPASSPKK